jgi:hypothetical protein
MSNRLDTAEAIRKLEDVVEALKGVDLQEAPAGFLVPLVKAVQAVSMYAAAVDAEIQRRAIANNEALPGVMVKDVATHRKWNDAEVAAALAFEQFGLKAFKLDSPAGIEKLGDEGKALVSVASTKPPGGKRAVY